MAAVPVLLAATAEVPVFAAGVLGGWLLSRLAPRARRTVRRGVTTTYRTLDRLTVDELGGRLAGVE